MYVCVCNAIKKREIEDYLKDSTPEETEVFFIKERRLGRRCGICLEQFKKEIDGSK